MYVHIGHRVSVVGVQGNVIVGREKYVLDHSWILSLEQHCFELQNQFQNSHWKSIQDGDIRHF